MPSTQLYAVLGDGNVRRNMTVMNMASRRPMESAKVIDCASSSTLRQALRDVPHEVTSCIVQSLSSILAEAEDAGSIYSTIDPVLTNFSAIVREYCAARESQQVLLAPPMFRSSPVWYRRGMPEILQQFSTVFSVNRPRNLHLLTSPVSQELGPDGIHLNPVSGLHYVIHLFDDSERLLGLLGSKG